VERAIARDAFDLVRAEERRVERSDSSPHQVSGPEERVLDDLVRDHDDQEPGEDRSRARLHELPWMNAGREPEENARSLASILNAKSS